MRHCEEERSAVFPKVGPGFSSKRRNGISHDAKAESRSVDLFIRFLMRAVKALEEVSTLAFWNADPVVVHLHDSLGLGAVIRGGDLSANLDPPLVLRGVGVLDRVRQQV